MPAEISQTLDRGLQLLEVIAAEPAGYPIGELTDRLGLNRTVVYRLVSTLERRGLVHRDGAGRITAGLGLVPLAGAVHPMLRARTSPVLRALADEVGATAHLTVAEADEAEAIAVVEPRWTDVHVAYRVGARHDVHDAAAGRAIVLARDPRPGAPAYVSSAGEFQHGAQGVAAPILGVDGLDASLGIVSLRELDSDDVGPRVVRAAAAAADALR